VLETFTRYRLVCFKGRIDDLPRFNPISTFFLVKLNDETALLLPYRWNIVSYIGTSPYRIRPRLKWSLHGCHGGLYMLTRLLSSRDINWLANDDNMRIIRGEKFRRRRLVREYDIRRQKMGDVSSQTLKLRCRHGSKFRIVHWTSGVTPRALPQK